MSKFQIIFDKNQKSVTIKRLLTKEIGSYQFKQKNLIIVIGGDGFMLQILKKNMISNFIKKAKIPVLILNKWSDLSKFDEKQLQKFYFSKKKLFNNRYLFQNYWKKRIT